MCVIGGQEQGAPHPLALSIHSPPPQQSFWSLSLFLSPNLVDEREV